MVNETEILCKHCILPSSGPIKFDGDGRCQLCAASPEGKPAVAAPGPDPTLLEHQVERIRAQGKGKPYDCIIGLSGGRDSSYLLHLLVNKHNLRCLAGYYRTPFTSDTTDANVRRMTSKLGVALVELELSQDYHKRIAREMTLLWKRRPHSIIINMACSPCKFLHYEIYRLAEKHGIPNIIFGVNRMENVQIAASVSSKASLTSLEGGIIELNLLKQIRKNFMLLRKGIDLLFNYRALWKYIPLGFKSSILYLSPHTPYLRFRFARISILEYFYFAEWDERECENALSELGWQLPQGCNSTWKSDCSFAELKNLMFKQTTNITYMDAYLSNLVRNGVITREEALSRSRTEGAPSPSRLAQSCEVLSLPSSFI